MPPSLPSLPVGAPLPAGAPVIAVTCDRRVGAAGSGPRVRPGRPEVVVGEAVVNRLREAGATVILLPPGDAAGAVAMLDRVDGVVISGGAFDIHPRHYGQAIAARVDRVDEERTGLELALARACVERGAPLLGVCGGMQALAVAVGGTLVQDIRTADPTALDHEQPGDPAVPGHALLPEPGWEWLGFAVNSTHHQAVADPGPLAVVARAPDGTIEAVAHLGRPFAVGVQWHPELLAGSAPLFRRLVEAAAAPRVSRP